MSQKNPAADMLPPAPAVTEHPSRVLSAAARRALAEAQARHTDMDRRAGERPKELHGRTGLDPARYGDWEVKGIASDF